MKQTIGEMIDQLAQLKVIMAKLNKELKSLTEKYIDIEQEVIDNLRDLGLKSADSTTVKVTLKTEDYPNVEDWEALYNFITENAIPYLLQRRLSVTGYRDLIEAGTEIPGVATFTKTSLSLTKLRNKVS